MKGSIVNEVAVKDVKVSGFNARRHFDEHKIEELTASIKEKGVVQPLVVRRQNGEYHLVCGERRLKASQKAGLKVVPVVVRKLTDAQAMEFQIIENLQREDLNAIDEAMGFKAMIKKCGYTQTTLAAKIGKSQGYIANRLRLLELGKDIQETILREIISPGHAIVILRLKDPNMRAHLFKELLKEKWSVRRAENELAGYTRDLKKVPFDRTECKNCLFKGDNQEGLVDKDTKLKGMCLSPGCFMKKAQAYIQKKREELQKKGFKVITEEKLRQKGISYYNAHTLSEPWVRKQLGAKYRKKCLVNCPGGHYYVIRTHEYGPQKGLQYIEEWCTNSNCYHAATRKDDKSNLSAGARKESQNQEKVRETNRRVWIQEVLARTDKKAARAMFLFHLVKDNGMAYEGDKMVEFLKRLGIQQKGDEKKEWYELEHLIIPRLYDASEAKVWKEIGQLVSERDVPGYDDQVLDVLAQKLGFNIRTDFIIDEEYLKKRTKDQLIGLAKEIGLTKYLEKKKICDRLGNKKKTELINLFLKQGFGLKGKVPKEIKKRDD